MTTLIDSQRRVMTSGEVAAYYRVDVKTVARWDTTGVLKAAFRTPGGHRRFWESDVLAAGQPAGGTR